VVAGSAALALAALVLFISSADVRTTDRERTSRSVIRERLR
jgi:hypothetical protein